MNVRRVKAFIQQPDDSSSSEESSGEDESDEQPSQPVSDEAPEGTKALEVGVTSAEGTVESHDTAEADADSGGLTGADLYRCANKDCGFSTDVASDFKDHLQICELSEDSTYLNCAHCDRSFKHVGTLMDHLKGHGPKRYSCSLCSSYRAAVPTSVKIHMRSAHHVNR